MKPSTKRKLKKRWGWIVGGLIVVAFLLVPLAEFQQSVESTEEKLNLVQRLVVILISTTEGVAALLAAVVGLALYKVLKNK